MVAISNKNILRELRAAEKTALDLRGEQIGSTRGALSHVPFDVAVVGGAAAGLGCATTLNELGARVQVYEGGARLGGRMHSIKDSNGHIIERGGECFNEDHHEMKSRANRYKIPIKELQKNNEQATLEYFIEGKLRSRLELARAIVPLASKLQKIQKQLQGRNHEKWKIHYDNMSLEDFFKEVKGVPAWAKKTLMTHVQGENGISPKRLTALYFFDFHYEKMTPKNPVWEAKGYAKYTLEGGMSRLIDAMAEEVQGKIHLEHKLTAVRKAGKKYELDFEVGGNKITKTVDYVVLALPYSVLRHVDLSQAGLTPLRMRAINELVYGDLGKLQIESVNNPQRGRKGDITVTDNFLGETAHVWNREHDGALGAKQSLYTLFIDNLDKVKKNVGSISKIVDAGRGFIKKLFQEDEPNGRAYVTDWKANPLARGSYSIASLGQRTELAGGLSPNDSPGIYFAGEHINIGRDAGFMNNALATGEYVAAELTGRMLLDHADNEKLPPKRRIRLRPAKLLQPVDR